MLNEMISLRFTCPLCGKPLDHFIDKYWCPFCGQQVFTDDEIDINKRLTARDENGIAVYIGNKSFRNPEYAPRLSQMAMIEILEKLCAMEEKRYDTE